MKHRRSTVRQMAGLAASALLAGLFVAPNAGAQNVEGPTPDGSDPAAAQNGFVVETEAVQRLSTLPSVWQKPMYFDAPLVAGDALAGVDADTVAELASVNGLGTEEFLAQVAADPTLMIDEAGVLFPAVDDFVPEPDAVRLDTTLSAADAVATLDAETLERIAVQNDLTVDQLVDLAADPTLLVDVTGSLLFVDLDEEAHEHDHDDEALEDLTETPFDAPFSTSETFFLHSRPGASKVIYLDFNGYNLPAGTLWNNGNAWAAPAFDPAGNGPAFSSSELTTIQNLWMRVAEDYAPFDVDVTTQDPGFAAIHRTNGADQNYGTRVVLANDDGVGGVDCNCGGVAYVGNYDNTGANHSIRQPAWVFSQGVTSTKSRAEAISHEAGHNLGLLHDGRTSPAQAYYAGHSPWAPIMGNGYYQPITQFSRGEYTNANQLQDDFAVIDANGLDYRADDHGGNWGTGTDLHIGGKARGIIERNFDGDMFEFTSCGGPVTITATPSPVSPNLDIALFLYTSTNGFVASNNPTATRVNSDVASGMDASITRTLAYGTSYQVFVDQSALAGLPSNGYSTYGSRGFYELTIDQATSCDMYAWADQPTTANYTVTNGRWANPAGGAPTVTRSAVGRYSVTFPGASILGGNVQVTSMRDGVVCKSRGWSTTTASVACFNTAGTDTDAEFSLYYSHDDDDAWLWSYTSGSSYTAVGAYNNNPSGGAVEVTRNAVGDYTVVFDGYQTVSGETQALVTAYGGGNTNHCTVDFWGSSSVGVDCYDITGARADAQFNVLLTKSTTDAFAWANNPGSASYSPSAAYRNNPTGGGVTAERLSTGQYKMTFSGLLGGLGNVQVSAYSSAGVCTIGAWSNSSATVTCRDLSGALIDTAYDLLFTPAAPILCDGLPVTVSLAVGDVATNGNDVIRGTSGNDNISALGGNDVVCASLGNDTVNGGSGNDRIRLGAGDDLGIGGTGDDRIDGLDGNDEIYGGDGDDLVDGGNDNDTLYGQGGRDLVRGKSGNDRLFGGADTDYVNGGGGDDLVDGGDGNDGLRGNGGNDELVGGSGSDWMWGDSGDDVLTGGSGGDDMRGGTGDDRIFGGVGNDSLRGASGSDFLAGEAGNNDSCDGGPDADVAGPGCEVITTIP